MTVDINKWGYDHWAVIVYLERRAVGHKGTISSMQMRCNPDLHPEMAHGKWAADYPTRLKGKKTITPHDDWSCVEDMQDYRLLTLHDENSQDAWVTLTDRGFSLAHKVRQHLAEGGSYESFWTLDTLTIAWDRETHPESEYVHGLHGQALTDQVIDKLVRNGKMDWGCDHDTLTGESQYFCYIRDQDVTLPLSAYRPDKNEMQALQLLRDFQEESKYYFACEYLPAVTDATWNIEIGGCKAWGDTLAEAICRGYLLAEAEWQKEQSDDDAL